MPGTYAADTDVSTSRSRDEIERTLTRFGADEFAYYSSKTGDVAISFSMRGRRVLLRMKLPARELFALDTRSKRRSESAIDRDHEQACRQRWRSLSNGIKAKLAMIDDEISTFEREFLADMIVPSTGMTYGDMAVPALDDVYQRNALPPLVP